MSSVKTRAHVRRRLPAEERRQVIVEAASEVFAELGFREASAVEIATRAGVTKQLMYRHFDSKDELYVEALEREMSALLAALEGPSSASQGARERIASLIASFFAFVHTRPFARRLLRDIDAGGDVSAAQEREQARLSEAIRTTLAEDPALLADDPDRELALSLLAHAMKLTLIGMATWWSEHPETDRDEVVRMATRLVLNGVESLDPGDT
jgi:AcrR family transcriptional regulator